MAALEYEQMDTQVYKLDSSLLQVCMFDQTMTSVSTSGVPTSHVKTDTH